MKLLSIGLSDAVDEVRQQLEQDCQVFSREGFRVNIENYQKGPFTFFSCDIAEGELSFREYEKIKQLMKRYVSDTLSEVIVDHFENRLIKHIIDDQYGYFSDSDRQSIYENSCSLLRMDHVFCLSTLAERKNKIASRIQTYFESNYEIILDGFIRFRLKDYYQELRDIVEKAVDEHMMEREYKEFIRLLKYFVDIHEPRIDEVHVVIEKNGCFRLLDSCGKAVNNPYLEGLIVSSNENDINYEDLLISALITIAPQTVMLHMPSTRKMTEMLETIRSVFDNRVVICEGCDLCQAETKVKYVPLTLEAPIE